MAKPAPVSPLCVCVCMCVCVYVCVCVCGGGGLFCFCFCFLLLFFFFFGGGGYPTVKRVLSCSTPYFAGDTVLPLGVEYVPETPAYIGLWYVC